MISKEIHILLVDDDEDYLVLTKDYLSNIPGMKFTIDWKADYESGLLEINRKLHDIYLIDFNIGRRNGLELITEVLAEGCRAPIIMLTGQSEREIDITALEIGADDFLEKDQLSSKLLERSIRYSIERKKLMVNLQDAFDKISTLNGLLPICSSCKKIRDDKGYWNKLEAYISARSNAEFSHGICPECTDKLYPGLIKSASEANARKIANQ